MTKGVAASGSNKGATYETGEPATVAQSGGSSTVWYTWTATATGAVTVSTATSSFDTTLAVYQVVDATSVSSALLVRSSA